MIKHYIDNIFTKIINRKIPTDILIETEFFISFYDINPQATLHILVIPKNKYVDYEHFINYSSMEEKLDYHYIISQLVKKFNLNNFKIIINNGKESGQEIFHFHIHILSF